MGKVTVNIGSSNVANGVCVQADGKILVAGTTNYGDVGTDFCVIRLNTNGTLDAGFGASSKAQINVGSHDDSAYAVALQSDGKILVAGSSSDADGFADFGITRLSADGTLDATFGTDGKATFSINGDDSAYSLHVQSDGKILLAGTSASAGSSYTDFSVIRLSTSGTLDAGFGTGGKATFSNGTGNQGRGLDVQADGKIVLAGWSTDSGHAKFSILRLDTDGTLDTSFSADGRSLISVGGHSDFAYSVKAQADGKIVLAGDTSNVDGGTDFAVIRLNSDGTLDTTFGAGGKAVCDVGGYDDGARTVAIQDGGAILVSGYSYTSGGAYDFSIARLSATGVLDESFGDGGTATINISGDDKAYSLALQSDGKILLAGTSSDDFSVVRLNADGSLDSSFLDGAIEFPDPHDPELDQAHEATGIHLTTFGLAVLTTIMPPPTTTHRATGIRSTKFGLAVGMGSATGHATGINSTTFGPAVGTSIAALEQGLQSTAFGLASTATANPAHLATSISGTTFDRAVGTSVAAADSVQGVRFGLPVGTSAAVLEGGVTSTTFGAATATCWHQVLPTMAGTTFGRARLERGIAC
jgi:uncharacterized delta-60 repeat protein